MLDFRAVRSKLLYTLPFLPIFQFSIFANASKREQSLRAAFAEREHFRQNSFCQFSIFNFQFYFLFLGD